METALNESRIGPHTKQNKIRVLDPSMMVGSAPHRRVSETANVYDFINGVG